MIPIITSMLAAKGLDALSKLVDRGADKALEVIADKTGIDLNKPDPLTTEQEQKLREYDLQLRTLDLEREKAYLSDKADARDMQKEALRQNDPFSKRFIYIFSILWSLFAVAYITAITFMSIPQDNIRFVDTVLGFLLGTVVAGMLTYFYGSSAGSQAKTEILHLNASKLGQ